MSVLAKPTRIALTLLASAFLARACSMALLPVTDSTEGRYAQVAQEMVLSGDWATPRIWMYGEHLPFMGKPPLFFWSAAAAMEGFGINAFSARLPSLLATLALLFLLYRVTERYGESGSGILSVMVTASCGLFFATSGVVAVDLLLSACVAGSLLAYFAFICEPDVAKKRLWSLLVFVLLALGFLTKGPVAIVLFGLPVFIWTVRWKQWKLLQNHAWLWGILLFLAITVPWFWICELRNPGFLKYFFVNENLLRFVKHDYGDAYGKGHLYPRGSAIWMFFAASAPWSALALYRAIRNRLKGPSDASGTGMANNFLLLGFLSGLAFWCLARQLLITYTLPLVPIFAVWFVRTMPSVPLIQRRILNAASAIVLIQGLLCLAVIPFLQNTSSSRHIVSHAKEYAAEQSYEGPLLFAVKTPYSGLFYARGWVVPHPKESLTTTLARQEHEKWPSVLVIADKHTTKELKTIPPENLKTISTAGEWKLVSIRLPLSTLSVLQTGH